MNSINKYFENAQLALAAYALNLSPNTSQVDYRVALEDAGMSVTQAAEFAATYAVVDQYSDPLSGFSATVFKKGNDTFFAIRGTELSFPNIFKTDLGDLFNDAALALGGVAADQTVAMYNYYQRLIADSGQTVPQLTLVVGDSGTHLRLDMIPGIGLGKAVEITQPLTVSGHSLGGHLAMAFGRLFNSSVGQLYTYDAPGFSTAAADSFFAEINRALGINELSSFLDDSRSTNLFGTGSNFIAGYGNTFGAEKPIFLESNTHSIVSLIDSLALYDVFAQLVPNVSTDTVSSLLQAASNKPSNSLESALDSLRKLFQVNDWQTKTTIDDRQAYYTNLFALQNSITQNGVSNLTLTSLLTQEAGTTFNNAQANDDEGLATRYALKELNPFVLSGNAVLYAPFGEALKAEHFSNAYLTDRVAFLYNLRDINIADRKTLFGRFLVNTSGEKILFSDLSSRTQIFFTPQGQDVPSNTDKRVIFGSNAADNITGQANADRLYGGDGNDTLSGNDGDDYLEGNLGDDRLYGGLGNDTYVYLGKEGNDTIVDSDGLGKILYSGQDLSGTKNQVGNNTELFNDGTYTYQFLGDLTAGGVLTITKDGDPDGKVTVENFKNGNLGITLNFQQAVSIPTNRDIIGDLHPLDFNPPNQVFHFDDLGNVITDGTEPNRADTLNDSAGNDHISSGGGNDVIKDFLGGNDQIETGAGQDIVNGGSGNDVIQGGADADILDGGAGNDQIFADTQIDLATAINQTGQPASPGQGEFLTGGAGDDIVIGGNTSDVLEGGAGDDILVGGAGDDVLSGDTDFVAANFNWTRTRSFLFNSAEDLFTGTVDHTDSAANGDDVIYGGDGNDDIFADRGNDFISGDAGNDFIAGGTGDDVILGGTGDDFLRGDGDQLSYFPVSPDGNDFIDGGDGNDIIFGEGGDDTLFGGAGDDQLFGGMGKDTLLGGDGNDQIVGDNGGTDSSDDADFMDAGAGRTWFWDCVASRRLDAMKWGLGFSRKKHDLKQRFDVVKKSRRERKIYVWHV